MNIRQLHTWLTATQLDDQQQEEVRDFFKRLTNQKLLKNALANIRAVAVDKLIDGKQKERDETLEESMRIKLMRTNSTYHYFNQETLAKADTYAAYEYYYLFLEFISEFIEGSLFQGDIRLQAYKMLVMLGTDINQAIETLHAFVLNTKKYRDVRLVDMWMMNLPKVADNQSVDLAAWQASIKEQGLQKATPLYVSKQITYVYPEHVQKNPALENVCHLISASQAMFEQVLEMERNRKQEPNTMPDLVINGSDIGRPGYCLVKFPTNDVRRYFLGHVTNSEESVGRTGEKSVAHIANDPRSANYVLLKLMDGSADDALPLVDGNINEEQYTLIGHGQAWRTEGGLVFNSWNNRRDSDDEMAIDLLEAFAKRVTETYPDILRVMIGNHPDSHTPKKWKAAGQVALPIMSDISKKYTSPEQAQIYRHERNWLFDQSDLTQKMNYLKDNKSDDFSWILYQTKKILLSLPPVNKTSLTEQLMTNFRGTDDYFTSIYNLAKNKDRDLLETLLKNNVCIDVLDNRGLFTPAGKLAAEGQKDAADLLMALGADASQVAMGYASAGDMLSAEKLRLTKAISLIKLGMGAAMYKDVSYANWLVSHQGAHPGWMAVGAGFVGNRAFAESIARKMGISLEAHIAHGEVWSGDCRQAKDVKKLAMGGYFEDAVALAKLTVNPTDYVAQLVKIVEALSRSGRLMALKDFLAQQDQGKADNKFSALPSVLTAIYFGAAMGGHPSIVKYSNDLVSATSGYFSSSLSQMKDNLQLVGELVKLDQLQKVCDIYNSHKLTHAAVMTAIVDVMVKHISFSNEQYVLYTLSFINDENFLLKLKSEVVSRNVFALRDFGRWIDKAILINHVMREYQCDYQGAMFVVDTYRTLEGEGLEKFGGVVIAMLHPSAPLNDVKHYELIATKLLVLKALNQYISSKAFSFYTGTHTSRAESLKTTVNSATSKDEIKTLLDNQLGLFSGTYKPAADAAKRPFEQPPKNADKTEGYFGAIDAVLKKFG
jgi:hypothetical protein